MARKPHLDLELRVIRIAEGHVAMHLAVLPILGKGGAKGDGIPEVLQSTTHIVIFFSCVD